MGLINDYDSANLFNLTVLQITNHFVPKFDAMAFESSSFSLKSEDFTDL